MLKLFFLALLTLPCAGFAANQPQQLPFYVHQSTRAASSRVLIVGDSITYSNCTDVSDGLCGWRKTLAAQCGKTADYYSFDTLSQVGISARTVNETFPANYGTQPSDFVTTVKYDAAFLLLGINDIGAGLTNLDELKKNYAALSGKINALAVKKLYLLTILPNCKYLNQDRPLSARQVVEMNSFIQTLAANNRQALDIYTPLQDASGNGCLRADYDSGDHLHPKATPQVQDALAGFVAAGIKADPVNPLDCR